MIGWLTSFLAGSAFKVIVGEIAAAHKRKLDATSTIERIEADKEIAGLEARRDALIAEARTTVNAWFRGFITFGPALYVFSYFAIDKVLCVKLGINETWPATCRVDAIDDPIMQGVMAAILGFFFLARR
jgi:hypothetical protein